MNITFTPGFNGGSVQTFRIEYKMEDNMDDNYTVYKVGKETSFDISPYPIAQLCASVLSVWQTPAS